MEASSLGRIQNYAARAGAAYGTDIIMLREIDRATFLATPIHLMFLAAAYIEAGTATLFIDDSQRTAGAGDLFLALSGHEMKRLEVSEDFQAHILLISPRFMQDSIGGMTHIWPYILHLLSDPVVPLGEREQRWARGVFKTLDFHLAWTQQRYLRDTLLCLARSFCFTLSSIMDTRWKRKETLTGARANVIFDEFFRLVLGNFQTQRALAWYGEKMCLSTKHLSETVKAVSGRTALEWIQLFVVIEAKRLLQDTNLSLKEISARLSFDSQSTFGKYFRTATGVSPKTWRREKSQTLLP